MGKRGPAPAPTKLKLIRGARPDRINEQEPSPEDHLPVPPADLAPAAAQVWMRVMAECGGSGVITAADTDVLRVYCEAVARYEEAAVALGRSGPLVKGARHGDLVKNPLHQIVRDDADLVVRLDHLYAEGDRVFAMMTWTGTHRAPLFGAPPSDAPITLRTAEIHRLEGGRIVEHWDVVDGSGVTRR